MKINLEPDELDVRIEMIPLVDVIFCILAFFILAAVGLARGEGINIDLPTAETGKTQLTAKVAVEVDAFGQIKVQETPVTEEQLVQFLASYVRKNPQGVIELYADKLVSYGQVVKLIDVLQKVGGNRVSLGTQPLGANTAPAQNNPANPVNPLQQSTQPFDPSALPSNPVTPPGGTTGIPNSTSGINLDGNSVSPVSPNNTVPGLPSTPGLQPLPSGAPAAPSSPAQP